MEEIYECSICGKGDTCEHFEHDANLLEEGSIEEHEVTCEDCYDAIDNGELE